MRLFFSHALASTLLEPGVVSRRGGVLGGTLCGRTAGRVCLQHGLHVGWVLILGHLASILPHRAELVAHEQAGGSSSGALGAHFVLDLCGQACP